MLVRVTLNVDLLDNDILNHINVNLSWKEHYVKQQTRSNSVLTGLQSHAIM